MNLSYNGIAFEGGGVAGTAYCGVIDILDKLNIYPNLTHFAGSSAGSMVAGLMACRMKPSDIKEILLNMDFNELKDNSWFIISDMYRFYNNYGWNKGDIIEKMYGDILEKYIGNRNITYEEVEMRYQSTLITTVTDVTRGETIYYTPESTPDMPIAKGIKESSSMPLFYCPNDKEDTFIVDGGVLNNYPIRKLYDYLPPDKVLGAKFVSDTKPRNRKYKKPKPKNIFEYIHMLIDILHDQNIKVHVENSDWERTIIIDIGDVSATDFELNIKDKNKLIQQGVDATNKFFTSQ